MRKIVVFAGVFLAITLVTFASIILIKPKQPVVSQRRIVPSIPPTPSAAPSPFPWTLLITGDIIPARVVNQKMVAKNDFMWPLSEIAPILQDADVTLIDLEAPLLTNCPITNEGFTFCGDAHFAESLATVGVDVANVANNHTLNYGWDGIVETQEHLGGVGIVTTGFSAIPTPTVIPGLTRNPIDEDLPQGHFPLRGVARVRKDDNVFECKQDRYCSSFTTKTVQGVSLGFLGYNAVGQTVDHNVVKAQIEKANTLVDLLIVSVHWGREYTRTPKSDGAYVEDPVTLGHLFIDLGADIVVGNHPHWYQGIEWYAPLVTEQSLPAGEAGRSATAKPIFYALGNTVFDQEWSVETRRGYLAKLFFDGSALIKEKLEIIPIGIRDYGQAYALEGAEKEAIVEFVIKE
ncbi:CapA family protein [Candidatus Microgenomates bacterium]|nr:MAG: CapA family protein [Candidatus Microgenomates bacterium]